MESYPLYPIQLAAFYIGRGFVEGRENISSEEIEKYISPIQDEFTLCKFENVASGTVLSAVDRWFSYIVELGPQKSVEFCYRSILNYKREYPKGAEKLAHIIFDQEIPGDEALEKLLQEPTSR